MSTKEKLATAERPASNEIGACLLLYRPTGSGLGGGRQACVGDSLVGASTRLDGDLRDGMKRWKRQMHP